MNLKRKRKRSLLVNPVTKVDPSDIPAPMSPAGGYRGGKVTEIPKRPTGPAASVNPHPPSVIPNELVASDTYTTSYGRHFIAGEEVSCHVYALFEECWAARLNQGEP